MLVRLQRNIYFHSKETGLISTIVYLDCNWEIIPVIGAVVENSAWHRNDITKIEEIIIPSEGNIYYLNLNGMETGSADKVERMVEIAKTHGWKNYS